MRIAIGSLQCESDSLSPILTRFEDFDLEIGENMHKAVHVKDMLEAAGAEIIPTIYAHALPGGPVEKEAYLDLANRIVDGIPAEGVDGVWLYLHGAMNVQDIGSGEEYLLERLREKLGDRVVISVAMDFHANNSDRVIELANVICGFRTAPHADRIETERKAMALLLTCLREGLRPKPMIARAPVIIPGDAVQTALSPLKEIMAAADEMEKLPEVLCAQVFGGQAWVDVPYMGPNMVVTCRENTELAQKLARELAQKYYDARYDFKFEIPALPPEDAIEAAVASAAKPAFISDSGDNTTAGAAGDNAYMLRLLLEKKVQNALLAGITDREACNACYEADIGDTVTLTVGRSLDPKSEQVTITGKLISRGEILGYTGAYVGRSAVVDLENGITVIVTERRTALCRPDIFESIHVDFMKYDVVVVKLGYLFPELAQVVPYSVLAFTPGSSTEMLKDMHHKNITRPIFPLDDHFM